LRGFAEAVKFVSLTRAAKFKGAVRDSVKFQRAKSKPDFTSRLQAAPWNLKDDARAYLSDRKVRKSRREIKKRSRYVLKRGAHRKDTAAKQNTRKRVKFTGTAGE